MQKEPPCKVPQRQYSVYPGGEGAGGAAGRRDHHAITRAVLRGRVMAMPMGDIEINVGRRERKSDGEVKDYTEIMTVVWGERRNDMGVMEEKRRMWREK